MSKQRTLARSFAGGEIAPELYGRLDLDKFQTGLALCRNFIPLPYGPVQNRPGFRYVNEVKDSTKRVRLIPFQFSVDETVVLEFGDQYIRFHTNGGTVLETAKNITGITQPAGVVTVTAHGYNNGDWVYLSGIGGMTQLNGRFVVVSDAAADTFRMKDFAGNYITTGSYTAYTSGGTAARVYELATDYLEAELFDLHYVQSNDVLTIVHPSYEPAELRRTDVASYTLAVIVFEPEIAGPTGVSVTATGTGSVVYAYGVTSLSEDGLHESPMEAMSNTATTYTITNVYLKRLGLGRKAVIEVTLSSSTGLVDGDFVFISGVVGSGSVLYVNNKTFRVLRVGTNLFRLLNASGDLVVVPNSGTYTSDGTMRKPALDNNLATAGNYNTLTWTPAAGATRYNVYKKDDNGNLYGYIGTTSGETFKDDNIIPDMLKTPPEYPTPFRNEGRYPATVAYFDQRRCFAATDDAPQTCWMTKAGTERNFATSIPTVDYDAISFRIASREQNRIRHMVALGDLLLLTAGGEWRVFAGNGDPLTPSTLQARPQSYVGASNVQPVTTSASALYVQAQGNRVRELLYADNGGPGAYKSEDMSVLVPHLMDGYSIVDMAFSRGPTPLLWAVRADGVLLGNTYLPEQRVRAWHQHDTAGSFESVTCVVEGNEDVLYAIVKRQINGRAVRHIERLNTMLFTSAADCFHVDSGLTYSGASASTISGLWHLEGETVSVLGDGAVFPRVTVTNGSITLDHAVTKAQIGLPITADLRTLPLPLEVSAYGQGFAKNVVKVWMRVLRSGGIFAGPDFDMLREFKQRTTEPYGSPPALVTDEIEIPLTGAWTTNGQVVVRQSDPLPLTIQSMTLEVAIGG